MLIHLGRGVSVHERDVIVLCDLQQPQASDGWRLAEQYRRRGQFFPLGDNPKTLVLCRYGTKDVCYLSCVGLRTLRQRMAERRLIEVREVQHG